MSILNPSDPFDLAAMLEVDAMYPDSPPIAPQVDLDARFEELEKQLAKVEQQRHIDRCERHMICKSILGRGYYYDERELRYWSKDGRISLHRDQVDRYR